jgi:lipopolysaccharide/colanic/teichoic acid biosynthesis glycosyltransferase
MNWLARWPSAITDEIKLKRLFDLLVSLGMQFVLGLPLLLPAWIVRLKLGRPVLFRQTWPGLHGQPLMIVKF